jgi:hypothetical protein
MSDTDASVVVRACGLRKEYGQNAGAMGCLWMRRG